jgi:hypothetical protein
MEQQPGLKIHQQKEFAMEHALILRLHQRPAQEQLVL